MTNEIERKVKHAKMWREQLHDSKPHSYSLWCVCVGLCETAGWIDENEPAMLEWVIPGHRYKQLNERT